MELCDKCLKGSPTGLIKTDHFRGGEIKQYCEDCFFEGAQTAFNDPDLVCVCGDKLVLEINNQEEIVDLAKEDEVIFYVCEKVTKARLDSNEEEVEKLESDHDFVGYYVIQPEEYYEKN